MIVVQPHIDELDDRTATVVRLLDATHLVNAPTPPTSAGPVSVSREARGLAVVLLFGAYENLLTSLTRTLLETAKRVGVGNKRLQPGFRAFAMANVAKSARDTGMSKLYSRTLPKLVETADPGGRTCTIDANTFPSDGSFMKRSQIELWCELFGIPDPHLILFRTWTDINAVVARRNAIAHGQQTPDEVGRNYTEKEIRDLTAYWHDDWRDFLLQVELAASSRDFFRLP